MVIVLVDNRFPVYQDDESYSRIVLHTPIPVRASVGDNHPLQFTVPIGFQSDMASIPRILLPIFPKNGRNKIPAIIHDYLYQNGMYDRETCDKIFLGAMEELNVKTWRRKAMYWAVRLFGGTHYKKI